MPVCPSVSPPPWAPLLFHPHGRVCGAPSIYCCAQHQESLQQSSPPQPRPIVNKTFLKENPPPLPCWHSSVLALVRLRIFPRALFSLEARPLMCVLPQCHLRAALWGQGTICTETGEDFIISTKEYNRTPNSAKVDIIPWPPLLPSCLQVSWETVYRIRWNVSDFSHSPFVCLKLNGTNPPSLMHPAPMIILWGKVIINLWKLEE